MNIPNTKAPSGNSVQFKKLCDKEIKEYAETAMNELLSWYGYNKIADSINDCQALNLASFPELSFSLTKKSSSKLKPVRLLTKCSSVSSPNSNFFSSLSTSSSSSISSLSPPPSSHSNTLLAKYVSSDSMENIHLDKAVDGNGLLNLINDNSAPNASGNDDDGSCSWCHNVSISVKNIAFKSKNGGNAFCSEICFSHYRRANFRRSKRCDWCHHVKSSVNCVDLQDGENQYQFCSDKCLNQFKLDIFCQETKEHLDIHPYHRDQLQNIQNDDDSPVPLITPDLWLRNCISPQNSTNSKSPSPSTVDNSSFPISCLSVEVGGPVPERSRKNMPLHNLSTSEMLLRHKEATIKRILKKPTKKKKKMHKLRYPLVHHQKGDSFSLQSESSIDTPKISFQPNFSTMLPCSEVKRTSSGDDLSCNSRLSKQLSHVPTPSFNQRTQKSSLKNPSFTTLPVPPLLPINVTSEFSSSPAQTSRLSSTSEATSASTNSVSPSPTTPLPLSRSFPPSTVFIPYPIILPILLPIPIPIPIPVPVKPNQEQESHNTSNKTSENRAGFSESN